MFHCTLPKVSVYNCDHLCSNLASTGINAISLMAMMEYSISLDSNTTYVATINITEVALYGEWKLTVQSQGSYSVLIRDYSTLIISTGILTIRSDSDYGNYEVTDLKPLEGIRSYSELHM